jgi:hypothetical protein
MNNGERQAEALSRARNGESLSNYPAIFAGFKAKGIAEEDIRPRENIFIYDAWQAQGRQVRKGERGVKVLTYVPMTSKADTEDEDVEPKTYRRPKTTTVFHISQTEEI